LSYHYFLPGSPAPFGWPIDLRTLCIKTLRPSTFTERMSPSLNGKLESSVNFVGREILGDLYTLSPLLAAFLATANLVRIFLTNPHRSLRHLCEEVYLRLLK